MRTFGRGDQVVWRSLPEGNVGYVFPATIVCDDDDVIGLFQHTGSTCKKRTGKRGGPAGRNMLPGGWDGGYSDREWTGRSNLHLHKMPTGQSLLFHATGINTDHLSISGGNRITAAFPAPAFRPSPNRCAVRERADR